MSKLGKRLLKAAKSARAIARGEADPTTYKVHVPADVDVRLALFTNSDYLVSVDNLARTSVRAVFGSISLDEAFSQREQIGTLLQTQMEEATDKWGVRINRVEVLEITPPDQILQAMALQKQADQEKRARILESEGQQQSAVNVADGQRQAAIK